MSSVHHAVPRKTRREVRRLRRRTKWTLWLWRRYLRGPGAVAIGEQALADGVGTVAIGDFASNIHPHSLVIRNWPERAVREALEYGPSQVKPDALHPSSDL